MNLVEACVWEMQDGSGFELCDREGVDRGGSWGLRSGKSGQGRLFSILLVWCYVTVLYGFVLRCNHLRDWAD